MQMINDTQNHYGLLTIILHWLSAMGVFFLFGLGIYMTGLGYYDEWYHKGPALHISLGVLLFLVTIFRLIWRKMNSTPKELSPNKIAKLAARLIKIFLYSLIVIIAITGYLITTAEGQAIEVFSWFSLPASIELSAANVDLAGKIHEYSAWLIILFATLHAAAALLHHFVFKDTTLRRMIFPK
jgi:cytochrome b561